MHRIFGIRHHGPGSARRLRLALEQWRPDCVLIEAPADAQAELRRANLPGLIPPVALVLYLESNLRQAIYLPFARFSPEWQALSWALEAGVPIQAIDLPAQVQWLGPADPPVLPEAAPATEHLPQLDPLGYLAKLAGYADFEAWWEVTFERSADDLEVFAEICRLIGELRSAYPAADSPDTLRREAHMREALRKAHKQGYARIAVVCGAWHAPALDAVATVKATADRAWLKGLPKAKTSAAWIPWSYPRLAQNSGYGAGVLSPAWYDLLYDHGAESATIRWLARAAQLLRSEGIDTSPAHVAEATRLAQTLATLQLQAIPGLDDLRAAALSVLCAGETSRLELIEARLVTGDMVGQTPEKASVVPLQQDLNKQLKSLRLHKYWGQTGDLWLKADAKNPRGGIDLREDNDRQKSHFLHRLRLLQITWGTPQDNNVRELGSFREVWLLKWQPEYSLRVIEAAMWGNTVQDAAASRVQWLTGQAESLTELTELLQQTLLAGLNEAGPALVGQLRQRAALTRDVQYLLPCLPGLVRIIQYGDARRTDTTALARLVEELTPRIAIGLPALATQIDAEAADEVLRHLLAADQALRLLALPAVEDIWRQALAGLSENPAAHPLLRGAATRLLFDRRELDLATAERRLQFALSVGGVAMDAAHWLAGFLPGSGLLLLHHPPLWALIDAWVSQLDPGVFTETLPLLRRTFARFPATERQQMLVLARRLQPGSSAVTGPADGYDPARRARLTQALQQWLGE